MNDTTGATAAASAGDGCPRECYTWEELYWWVKLITKRAGLRTYPKDAERDLAEARVYMNATRDKLAALCAKQNPTVEDILEAETGENHLAYTASVFAAASR